MVWNNPLPVDLIPTGDGESFSTIPLGYTGLPIAPHPGAFGVQRRHHIHEGVDLYCPEGTAVRAVEPGIVVAVIAFTGEAADPPSPWWNNTEAVMIEGESGVVLYGEITSIREVGDHVDTNTLVGFVIEVLKTYKGRPMSMLHLELHRKGTCDSLEWVVDRPSSLLDPTSHLLDIVADDAS